ncbi:AAA-domain-containing protein [Jaminaea rosea]|uniref:AAA-domain-containing protein n=1 Tax=Jaminaea rosea TaxID=1569628 RepID=A0A316UQN4_9BASI|nr:AAA-domain-containing protein [Jaminaea rosea]PWN25435.1 AAA-domain-containing protein [Jaminaea rosea]
MASSGLPPELDPDYQHRLASRQHHHRQSASISSVASGPSHPPPNGMVSTRGAGSSSGHVASPHDDGNAVAGGSRRSSRAGGRRSYKEEDIEDDDGAGSPDPIASAPVRSSRRRSADEDPDADVDAEGDSDEEDDDDEKPIQQARTRSGRVTNHRSYTEPGASSDSDEDHVPAPRRRAATSKSMGGFVVDDGDDDVDRPYGSSSRRSTRTTLRRGNQPKVARLAASKRAAKVDEEELDSGAETEDRSDDQEEVGRSYRLRERKKVDYSLTAPPAEPERDGFGRPIKRTKSKTGLGSSMGGAFELGAGPAHLGGGGRKGKTGWDALPLSMTGQDYARMFGEDNDDSSDDDIPASRKAPPPALIGASGSTGGLLGSGPAPADGANEGSARDALGRIKKGGDSLADIDPLGVNMAVDFDSVGGLDGHIQQLKEMVSLPLLYPEVFQQFKVTPPRGVLFHGPPGTGKTLVARALAASCSTSGQQISFFMRKGADCLSKWVGEAERQLRLLFDEARASQPSIIFFDEIDGLAPVRSSKQDQIHASIVSTLLALMDGMDGRGQVVVIGATNRPDSVDPALRRPGRFDREFYFPLPSREARRSIINIHTKGWDPPLSDAFKEQLSEVTKGYGGADLRALCTEAALNAIQRRYPQIYQTSERLVLQPETIKVEAKDFMMSVNKLVPSSARSSTSAAAPLPEHLRPLLGRTVDEAIAALQKVLPPSSKRNPLEEALWEDDGDDGADGFGREMMLQSFESLRIFRPRLVIAGQPGMGQSFIGAALLHQLEGYHVQSLDIGALMGDSARTPEAAVVQLFVEAKRHKPSVLFIPGLVHWAHSVSDAVRATTKALLDELSPSDPVLLLAVAEAPLSQLPADVAKWFGYLRDNKIEATLPSSSQREAFFSELLANVRKPPSDFPDALPRRKRILEELPRAPPRPPRQLTQAELQQQAAEDHRTLEQLKYRLGPILNELRKKFKKFTRDPWDEYELQYLTDQLGFDYVKEKGKIVVTIRYAKGFRPRRRSTITEVNGLSVITGSGDEVGSHQPAEQPQRGQSAPAEQPSDEPGAADVSMSEGAVPAGAASQPMPGSNGGMSSLGAAMTFGAPPPPPPQATDGSVTNLVAAEVPATNGDGASGAMAVAAAAADPTAAPNDTASTDDALYDTRAMTIYTMNLERMQKRLYYNGYLTIADFLTDLSKIVSNAETAEEVDQERMVRAHQMRNMANIMLDQYIDVAFRAECERMAVRQRAREEEKRRADEAAKSLAAAAAAGGVPPPKPTGERFSARVQGQAPEHQTPVDVRAIERNKRRQESVDAEGQEANKKARSGSREGEREQEEQQAVPLLNGNGASSQSLDGSQHDPAVAAHPHSAPAAHPPFICPPALLSTLSSTLLSSSQHFNIDQLLQLRAASFDLVWRERSQWDRTALIHQLMAVAEQVKEAVELERRDDEERARRDAMV